MGKSLNMNKSQLNRITIESPMIVDYMELGNKESSNVLLILHGYGQNSQIIKESLSDILMENDYHIIIPNGPFPIPKVRDENVLYRFAWYFFNRFEKNYFIDFSVPKNLLKTLLNKIAPNKNITVIGYSQGGYLAPFVGEVEKSIEKVIGINCKFRDDMIDDNLNFELHHIHDKNDQIVEYEPALESFKRMESKLSTKSTHHSINSKGHALSDEIIETLKTLL